MSRAPRLPAVLAAVCLAAAAPSAAQQAPAAAPGLDMPQPSQIINLNVLEALAVIQAEDLAGVFAYIPEANAAPALAHYLLYNKSALKRFIKKSESDLKELGVINEWDKQVCAYMIGLHSSGILSEKAHANSGSFIDRISTLSAAPGLPLSEISLRRKK